MDEGPSQEHARTFDGASTRTELAARADTLEIRDVLACARQLTREAIVGALPEWEVKEIPFEFPVTGRSGILAGYLLSASHLAQRITLVWDQMASGTVPPEEALGDAQAAVLQATSELGLQASELSLQTPETDDDAALLIPLPAMPAMLEVGRILHIANELRRKLENMRNRWLNDGSAHVNAVDLSAEPDAKPE